MVFFLGVAISITDFRKQLVKELAKPKEKEPPKRRTHTFTKSEGPGPKKRKKCRECYKKLRTTMSSRDADKKVTKVITYCDTCENKPGMCLPCFNEFHRE